MKKLECAACGHAYRVEHDPEETPRCPECDAVYVPPVVLGFRPTTLPEQATLAGAAAAGVLLWLSFLLPWVSLRSDDFAIRQNGLQAAIGSYSVVRVDEADMDEAAVERRLRAVLGARGEMDWHPADAPLLLVPLLAAAAVALSVLSLRDHPRAALFPFASSFLLLVALGIYAVYVVEGISIERYFESASAGKPWVERSMGLEKHFGMILALLSMIGGVVAGSSSILLAQKRTRPPRKEPAARGERSGRRRPPGSPRRRRP